MNLILRRSSFTPAGIFGNLFDDQNNLVAVTLEHSFPGNRPKLANGVYQCRRGIFRLEHEAAASEKFEVTGVPDFDGKPVTHILFHIGNFNRDSEGCVLLGDMAGVDQILGSRDAFDKFMDLQAGLAEFTLTVKSP